jgi:uncharacterized protein with HEPN domain
MKRADESFVDDIMIAASSISDYVRGVTMEDFLSKRDAMIQDAVIRQVGIIGEAASKLSATFRASHPTVSWHEIVGMRNVVVHQYWDVDLNAVWEAATVDIPALVRRLRPPPTVRTPSRWREPRRRR